MRWVEVLCRKLLEQVTKLCTIKILLWTSSLMRKGMGVEFDVVSQWSMGLSDPSKELVKEGLISQVRVIEEEFFPCCWTG